MVVSAISLRTAVTVPIRASIRSFAAQPDQRRRQRVPKHLYRYVIDVHGQLFLHDTVPKNLTSCFKNADFLNFFFTRLCANVEAPLTIDQVNRARAQRGEPELEGYSEKDWSDALSGKASSAEASALASHQGYQWQSPCQGELNFIRADDSPVVFRELTDEGQLRWAGDLKEKFDPTELFVHSETGRLYTRSPLLSSEDSESPFGSHSLLSSSLVLQHLVSSLQIDDDLSVRQPGSEAGSIEWQGRSYPLRVFHARRDSKVMIHS